MKYYAVILESGLYLKDVGVVSNVPILFKNKQRATNLAQENKGRCITLIEYEDKILADIISLYEEEKHFSRKVYENRDRLHLQFSFENENKFLEIHFLLDGEEIWWTYGNQFPDLQDWCIENLFTYLPGLRNG